MAVIAPRQTENTKMKAKTKGSKTSSASSPVESHTSFEDSSSDGGTAVRSLFGIPMVSLSSSFLMFARSYLLRHVNLGTEQILKIQRLRTSFLDKYFLLASLCGSEVFYTLLLPFIYWIVDPELGRMIACLLTLGIFTGNFLKNLLCLPRPPSPPVWTPSMDKETLDNRDYGWPSSHSINAISLPFFTLRFFLGFVWLWESQEPWKLTLWYTFAFWWSGSIILSRMYLGVHSPADVSGGMIIGVVILRAFLFVCDSINAWILASANVPIVMHALSFVCLLLHPQSNSTFTFAETTSILGWLTGILSGNQISQINSDTLSTLSDGIASLTNSSIFFSNNYWAAFSTQAILKPLARFVLGILIQVPIYLVIKQILILLVFGRGYKAPTLPRKTDLNFRETLVKFFSYSSLGWCTTYLAPILFSALSMW